MKSRCGVIYKCKHLLRVGKMKSEKTRLSSARSGPVPCLHRNVCHLSRSEPLLSSSSEFTPAHPIVTLHALHDCAAAWLNNLWPGLKPFDTCGKHLVPPTLCVCARACVYVYVRMT